MADGYEIHVISNTHWDREWLCNFQETRLMLVEFFDALLGILDTEPQYRSFLLDSQTAPVEDYLELRPEAEERIRRHVSDGRLFIGPWYTAPECFLVNGESLVRNLLIGHCVARAFGKVMKVGHTPFSYGQNSQMPQIYMGFGIDTMLFYHGVSHEEIPNEFWFEGADGTRILASQMSSGARYNFYHNVYRGALYGSAIDDREYDYAKGGVPFHRCDEAHCMEHHLLLRPERHYFRARIKDSVRDLRQAETEVATTRYLAFMQGHDSSLPDPTTLRIITDAQKHLPDDFIFHSTLPELMERVKGAVGELKTLCGERRTPTLFDVRYHLYSDVTSSRSRIKRLNAQAEHLLQRVAEPLASAAMMLGAPYPRAELDLAWKTLLKCHAHDSIAGSGVDDIERDMTDRLRQVTSIADGVTHRAAASIQARIDNSAAGAEDVLLTVFNPTAIPRSEVLTVVVDLPGGTGYKEVAVAEAEDGAPQPIQLVSRKPHHSVVNHAGDATAMMTCDRAVFHFRAGDVPALGYATYRLVREKVVIHDSMVKGQNTMENEHLRVRIQGDGTLTIRHKETGETFEGLHYFEDGGEAGHAWMHIEPGHDRIVTSHGCPVEIALEEEGPLLARYRVDYHMTIPQGLDENGGDPWRRLDGSPSPCKRSDAVCPLNITSHITLRKGSKSLDVVTRFDNHAKNHRLRVVFPSRRTADVCHVESAFDVVERPVVYGPDSPWHKRTIDPTFPMQRFVDVSGKAAGLTVLNDGLREYQVTSDEDRAIALTLLRAYEVSLTTVSKRWEIHPEMGLSQCPGAHEFRYAIYPHKGGWEEAGIHAEADRMSAPLLPAQVGPGDGSLPRKHGLLSVEPSSLVLSALKQAEDGDGLVVRLHNPTGKRITGKLTSGRPIRGARLVTLEETPLKTLKPKGGVVPLRLDPKKIITLRLTFRGE